MRLEIHRFLSRRNVAAFTATGLVCAAAVVTSAAPASATMRACDSTTKTWAADYPTYNDWWVGQGATECFGIAGTTSYPPYNSTQVFCAGNNSGTVTYYDPWTGTDVTHTFWPDHSYAVYQGTYEQYPFAKGTPTTFEYIDVLSVSVTGSSGGAGC